MSIISLLVVLYKHTGRITSKVKNTISIAEFQPNVKSCSTTCIKTLAGPSMICLETLIKLAFCNSGLSQNRHYR